MPSATDFTLAPTSPPTCAPAESPRLVSGVVLSIDAMADCSILILGGYEYWCVLCFEIGSIGDL